MAGTSPAMTARLGKPSCPAALPSISRVMAGLVPAIHAVVLTQDRHKDRASLIDSRIKRTFQARGQCFMLRSRWIAARISS